MVVYQILVFLMCYIVAPTMVESQYHRDPMCKDRPDCFTETDPANSRVAMIAMVVLIIIMFITLVMSFLCLLRLRKKLGEEDSETSGVSVQEVTSTAVAVVDVDLDSGSDDVFLEGVSTVSCKDEARCTLIEVFKDGNGNDVRGGAGRITREMIEMKLKHDAKSVSFSLADGATECS